ASGETARQLLLAAEESITDALAAADSPRAPQPLEESFDEEAFTQAAPQTDPGEAAPGPVPMPPPDNAAVAAEERSALVAPVEAQEPAEPEPDEPEDIPAPPPAPPADIPAPPPPPGVAVQEPAPAPPAPPVAADLPALAREILAKALALAADSVHLEAGPAGLTLRFRLAGQMVSPAQAGEPSLPATAPAALADAFLALAPASGESFDLDLAGRPCRFRLVSCPSRHGRTVVVYPQTPAAGLDRLGLTPADAATLGDLLTESYGFILAAGMSAAETASALRAMLSVAAGPSHSVALIERASRLELERISHCLVGEDSPAPAVNAYSAADVDVVVLDAIANAATARAVCLTGRDLLVLAGIGARGAADAIARLIDLQVASWAMADSMLAVLQQHNARRLCDACKQSVAPDGALLQRLGLTGEELAVPVYAPGSCDACGGTGHVGRMSVRSLVPLAGQVADLVRREAGPREIARSVEALARAALCRAGLAHVVAGHISLDELVRIVGE
ncbi:MAG: ATPase, T2SS/T4P/T4SS family, partial [Planctomycetota bacterium]|nr:ATPase, T2SS/T4P/T4SS family [Planctomycetota bacterium]